MADASVVAHVDEDGNTFYEDPATGVTAWSAQELAPAAAAAAAAAAEEWAVEQAPAEDDTGGAHEQWEVHTSAEGHAYYFNPVSGLTRWELPCGASMAEGDATAAAAAAAAAAGDADAEAAAAATAAAAVRDWGEPEHPVMTLTVPRQTSISWDGGTEQHHHAAAAAATAAGAPDVKRPTTPAGAPPPRKHSAAAKSRWALVRRASERFELGERVGSPGRQIIRRGSEGGPGVAGGAAGGGSGSGSKGGSGLLAIATAVQQHEAALNHRQHPASPTHSAAGSASTHNTPPVSPGRPGRPGMVLGGGGGGGGLGADSSSSSSSAGYGAAAMRAAAARVAQLEGDLSALKTRFVANLKTLAAQQQKAAEEARAHAACREDAAQQLAAAEEARAAAAAAAAAAVEEAEEARAAAQAGAEQARLQVLELDELARSLQAQLDDALGESSAMGKELAALRAEAGDGDGDGADGATARLRQQLADAREENRTIRELAKKAADTNTSLISMIAAPPPRGERPEAGRERRGSTSFMLHDAAETAAAEARAMAPSPQGGAGVGGARGAAAALEAAAAASVNGVSFNTQFAKELGVPTADLSTAAKTGEAARLESEAAELERKDAGGTSSHARTVSSGRVPRKRSSFRAVSPGAGHGSELGSIAESER